MPLERPIVYIDLDMTYLWAVLHLHLRYIWSSVAAQKLIVSIKWLRTDTLRLLPRLPSPQPGCQPPSVNFELCWIFFGVCGGAQIMWCPVDSGSWQRSGVDPGMDHIPVLLLPPVHPSVASALVQSPGVSETSSRLSRLSGTQPLHEQRLVMF